MTLSELIKNRIRENKPGWCFTALDFGDLGGYHSTRRTLSRLVEVGLIKRATEGLYYYPRFHDTLNELPVEINAVISAIQRAHHVRCQPSGAYAANLLGLSEQVPAKITILTDGASKRIQIGNREIQFKKTTPKMMAMANTITGLVTQAIRYIGKKQITPVQLRGLKARLSLDDINKLRQTAHLAPAWIAKLIMTELVGK